MRNKYFFIFKDRVSDSKTEWKYQCTIKQGYLLHQILFQNNHFLFSKIKKVSHSHRKKISNKFGSMEWTNLAFTWICSNLELFNVYLGHFLFNSEKERWNKTLSKTLFSCSLTHFSIIYIWVRFKFFQGINFRHKSLLNRK